MVIKFQEQHSNIEKVRIEIRLQVKKQHIRVTKSEVKIEKIESTNKRKYKAITSAIEIIRTK